ncbi:phosphatidate cytidylyltransferase [Spirochaeta africana]|uniref:Phosphatidate cytidylyltransferase n=1 Tax=Spirochaeta africana (strain ATCC 700263 / DSM 8902 / Z-7692) TaxID=889378 RepID=H9UKJ7_SPIAZ|nr:phosphatidate cytidylyltransferase [Spirochaeta africana]AFG38040.1 putative CDP-diglyceride synthetase/phosphatidate cytidylyltransferase [Spirochaeta africana DSM 8902]
MNKKQRNIRNRLLVFFIGIPAIFALLVLLPQANHAAAALAIILVSSIATGELAGLFENHLTDYPGSRIVIPLLGMIFPVLWYLEGVNRIPVNTAVAIGVLAIALILGLQAFRRDPRAFAHIKGIASLHILLLLYPGIFLAYILRIATLPMSSHLLVIFVITVYLNDSAAYAGGMLFGKGNSGLLPISPNKSIAGFASGLFASGLVTTSASLLYPGLFPGGWITALPFGLIIGCVAIIGDLAESAIKRSAAQKDSGSIIPGRGGLLDSIDSLAYAAPFFYYGYLFLQGA